MAPLPCNKKVTSRSNTETVAFFGELNPFSNFYTVDGEEIHSSK